jgi:hypothetical protein
MARPRELTAAERARLAAEGPQVFESVIGSPHPLFSSMQPRIKHRDTEAWRRAYSVVFTLLKDYRADKTSHAIDMEFTQTGITDKPKIIEDERPDTAEELSGLQHSIPDDNDDEDESRVSQQTEILTPARPGGGASESALLTQPARVPLPDEEEEYEYEQCDPPECAESGVQPEPLSNGSFSQQSDNGFDIQLSGIDAESDD